MLLTAFRNCERVALQGCYTFSDYLFCLVYTAPWNLKHPSKTPFRSTFIKTDLLPISEKILSYSFFANQRLLIMNSSIISTDYELSTNKSLANITFTDNDIGKIIRDLDRNKAYVHDMMSTCMLKICGDFVYKPLGLIFRACLDHEMFPQNWKKVNVLLIHIKK